MNIILFKLVIMNDLKYTYEDSLAGMQRIKFNRLYEIIEYIENFDAVEDSNGYIFQNGEIILEYISNENGIEWTVPRL